MRNVLVSWHFSSNTNRSCVTVIEYRVVSLLDYYIYASKKTASPQSPALISFDRIAVSIHEIRQTNKLSSRAKRRTMKRPKDKWVNAAKFFASILNRTVVYRRHLRERRVVLGIRLVLAIEKSRTGGYLYLYGQLFSRTLKSAGWQELAAAGKFSASPRFPYKAFVELFLHRFRARISRPPSRPFFRENR